MANRKVNFQKLIPDYWYGIYLPDEEALVFLGSENLRSLKQYWRRKEREMTEHIKYVQARLNMLDGKTIDDIRVMASKYEHPEFPKIGTRETTTSRRIQHHEPLDMASLNRKKDATTLNFCGWCKYCEGGMRQYGYHVTTSCSLIPEEFNNGKGTFGNDVFHFNTPCAVANGTQELLEASIDYMKAKLASVVVEKAEIGDRIKFITNVMKQAEKKPYFASCRALDWFKIDDDVACFIEDARQRTGFVAGKVVDCYPSRRGYVAVPTGARVHDGKNLNGHGLGYGLYRPEVMHRWEYDYFKSHPDYLKIWLRVAKANDKSFEVYKMAKVFAKK